ncbi:hypothetical protein ACFQ05_04395 [Amycolatopsis umgeniensis]|uniref:Uncharacterized protein n=1 Tax=Amycolatopsis umgeniensis TaxID=336628 RepID=A0A841AXA9_9PSEU|nr:hypothetical protein [Amycolatopsis umgeniensis]MBB5852506.1 hypothetical protein [Amycolatopsis umgeniensis]
MTPDGARPSTPDEVVLGTAAGLLRMLLERNGTWVLCKVFGAFALFLALHLIRIPLVLLVRVLAGVIGELDGYTSRQITTPPRGPINHYYDPATTMAGSWEHAHVRT